MEILILNGSYFYKLALEALPMKSNVQQLQIWIIERDDSFTVYLRPLRFDTLFFYYLPLHFVYEAAGQTFSKSNNTQRQRAADKITALNLNLNGQSQNHRLLAGKLE